MWKYSVYIHRRRSDGSPFYVGKGSSQKRCHDRSSRNRHWRNIVAKHGLLVEIVMSCRTDVEARLQEVLLIAKIGRCDLGKGPLVNKTDGGDGHTGLIASSELRRKRSLNASARRSTAWIASIQVSRKDGGNGGVVKHGDKLAPSWAANIAASKTGR